MISKFRKHVSRLVTTGAINVKKNHLPKSRSMLKSFNSLLIKFNVSTQETSCQNFFSSLLYVREFFLDNSFVQEFFSYANALAGYFFQNHPPPPSEVKWLAPKTLVRKSRTSGRIPKQVRDSGPSKEATRLKGKKRPRLRLGEEKVLLHS